MLSCSYLSKQLQSTEHIIEGLSNIEKNELSAVSISRAGANSTTSLFLREGLVMTSLFLLWNWTDLQQDKRWISGTITCWDSYINSKIQKMLWKSHLKSICIKSSFVPGCFTNTSTCLAIFFTWITMNRKKEAKHRN